MYTFSCLKEGFLYLLTAYICPIKKHGSRTPEDIKNGGTHPCNKSQLIEVGSGWWLYQVWQIIPEMQTQRNHQSTNNVPSTTTIFTIIPNTICFIYLCCIPLTFVLPCFTGKITPSSVGESAIICPNFLMRMRSVKNRSPKETKEPDSSKNRTFRAKTGFRPLSTGQKHQQSVIQLCCFCAEPQTRFTSRSWRYFPFEKPEIFFWRCKTHSQLRYL